MELDERIHQEICDLSQEGDKYLDDDNFGLAEKKYLEALNLIPKPKVEWEASTWLYVALGEVHFFASKYLEALPFFREALKCPEGLGNPLINLRIGQCHYELGNYDLAKEHLLKAYMVEGKEIFEEEDDKYIKFVDQIK
jgi:Tetratricopeptide repeat.